VQAIHDHEVLIIQGKAGLSKTSTYSFNLIPYLSIHFFTAQLTQYLYGEMQSQDAENKIQKRMMILCRKPRHIAAVSAAKRVVEQRNVKLADRVWLFNKFRKLFTRSNNN
jgi:HrpA-like RNA helicase